jgi:hypothetical protein
LKKQVHLLTYGLQTKSAQSEKEVIEETQQKTPLGSLMNNIKVHWKEPSILMSLKNRSQGITHGFMG